MINFKSVLASAVLLGVVAGAAPASADPVVKYEHVKKGAWVCGYKNRFDEVVFDYRCFWRPYSFYFDGPVKTGHFDDLYGHYYLSRHYRWHPIHWD